MSNFFFIIGVVGWLLLGGWVLNHNVAPLGSVTLHWPNPTRPTPHFVWQVRPSIQDGRVVVPAASSRPFAVTLPRGFLTGVVRLQVEPLTAGISIQPRLRAGVVKPTTQFQADHAVISIDWGQLAARGHSFSFSVVNTNADQSLAIKSIAIELQR